jgi:hypothetical protein
MDIMKFLEQAAKCVRYKADLDKLLVGQSHEVSRAVLSNDVARLRRQISSDELYANEVDVVRRD